MIPFRLLLLLSTIQLAAHAVNAQVIDGGAVVRDLASALREDQVYAINRNMSIDGWRTSGSATSIRGCPLPGQTINEILGDTFRRHGIDSNNLISGDSVNINVRIHCHERAQPLTAFSITISLSNRRIPRGLYYDPSFKTRDEDINLLLTRTIQNGAEVGITFSIDASLNL